VALKNRKSLEQVIHEYLSGFLIPKDLIESLCNDDIDQAYLDKVTQLNMILMQQKSKDLPESKALQEIRPELERLKTKVSSRARNFLMAKMNNLKKPKTNFQIHQESILLKYKPLVIFLREHY